ncbi:TlpA family protein disulfide reductase [Virgibacillus halophilus]|uniref:TlpA family protein disulfide reductase n=1 Tax=Tigheibacillus halophilus TaxID=361280 RepID=UPI0036423673
MKKNMIGIAVLVILAAMLVFNLIQNHSEKKKEEKQVYDVSGDTDAKGAVAYPENATFPETGEKAKDFEVQSLDGKTLRLSDLRGKKVMLNFWATWCPPCKKEMPEIEKFNQKHQDDIEIVAVNIQESGDKVKKFIDQHHYHFPIYLDQNGQVSNEYSIYAIPTTYFIGSDGTFQQPRHSGPMTYSFMVETLQKLN